MRYGLSVFEGIRAYRQDDGSLKPFMLEQHLCRMRSSLALMCLPDPGLDEVPAIIGELILRNELCDDVYIRPSVHAINLGDLNVDPVTGLTIHISPMGRKKWLRDETGMRATISAMRKLPHDAFPSSAKCIAAYAGSYIAATMAGDAGFDVPLLLNHNGFVTEAPTAAIFIVRKGVLLHPPASDGVLPSVTAFALAALARGLGIKVFERHLRPEDVATADEAFLCGTGLELAPIASLDGRAIGQFDTRPVTRSLVDAYFRAVRGNDTVDGTAYDL